MAQFKLSDVNLVFFNQYRQLCVYDNVSSSNNILATYVLLQTTGSVKRYVSILKDGSNIELNCLASLPTLPAGGSWTPVPYNFADDAGQIWLDPNNPASIVIGMGDIRDGYAAEMFWYPLPPNPDPTITPAYLVIECVSPFKIKIHHFNITVLNEVVSSDTIVCPE